MAQKVKFMMAAILLILMLGASLPSLTAQEVSPVAEEGPYQVGVQTMQFTDARRDNRVLEAYIWYPAQVSTDTPRPYRPDATGAPYPLLIASHGYGESATDSADLYIEHLVSHGYVVVGPNHQDQESLRNLVDRPLDVLLLLNQLADIQDGPLLGVIDTDNVGIIGFSFGGYTAVATGGARIDPGHFSDWCSADRPRSRVDLCEEIGEWDQLSEYHDQLEPSAEDGLWSAMTDERIHAVMALEPCFGQLFGESGLSAMSLPTFIVGGSLDDTCLYDFDTAYMYAHLGSPDRYLVTLEGRNHDGILRERNLLKQYSAAFFGYYLQGETDYAQYMTPDSASTFSKVTLEAQIEDS